MARVNIELNPIFQRLEKELGQVNRKVNRLTKTFDKNSRSSAKAAGSGNLAAKAFKAVGVAIAGIGIGLAVRGFIGIAKQFEILRIRLRTFTSSQQESNSEWERLIGIAAQTQVDVDQLIGAYTTLRTVGITPLNSEILKLADFAAASGQSFEQLTNIIFRGASSTELFYNIGVIARKEGEKLRVTYQGVEQVIEGTSRGILDYIAALTESNGFTGAATEIAKGLTGSLSNLSGNFKALVDQMGITSGITDVLSSLFASMAQSFEDLRKRITETGSVWFALGSNVRIATVAIVGFAAVALTAKAFTAWKALRLAILGASQAMKRFTLSLLTNPIGLIITAIVVAIVALVAAFVYFRDGVSTAIAAVAGFVYERMLNIRSIFIYLMPDALEDLANAFGKAFDYISEKVAIARDWIVEKLREVSQWFGETIDYIKEKAGEIDLAFDLQIPDALAASFAEDKKVAAEWAAGIKISTLSALNSVADFYEKGRAYLEQGIFGTTSATRANPHDMSISAPGAGVSEEDVKVTETRRQMIENILEESIGKAFTLNTINYDNLLEAAEFAYGEQLLKIEERIEKESLIEAEAYQLRLNAFTNFEQKRTDIAAAQAEERNNQSYTAGLLNLQKEKNFEDLTNKQKGESLRDGLQQLSQYSEKAFQLNKVASIAEAIINTFTGATAALKAGPFIGPILAGITVATGLAQVAAIRAQTFSPPRQFGGDTAAGKAYTVGENGRETFVPTEDGQILPNEDDGGPSLGNTVNNFNVTVMSSNLEELMDDLNEMSVNRSGDGFVSRPSFAV